MFVNLAAKTVASVVLVAAVGEALFRLVANYAT